MSDSMENKRQHAELYRVMAARFEMEAEIEKAKANIARLEENIQNQIKREAELKKDLKIN